MRNPFKRQPSYSCYYLTIHFASAEAAAKYANEHGLIEAGTDIRMRRGGETLPRCIA